MMFLHVGQKCLNSLEILHYFKRRCASTQSQKIHDAFNLLETIQATGQASHQPGKEYAAQHAPHPATTSHLLLSPIQRLVLHFESEVVAMH